MRFARALALLLLALSVGGWDKKDKILIGHVGSMTGGQATFGDSTDKGIRLAINEQAKKGGIDGAQVELKTLDDQGKPVEAAVAATRLISQDKVAVLIG